jgi:hypothetical protein
MRAVRLLLAATAYWGLHAQPAVVAIKVDLARTSDPMDIDKMALGQGGLSAEPMWDSREVEIRMLHPRIIRLFLQQYFDPLPEPNRYHWNSMDRSVDLIRSVGAEPLMTIAFKPKSLYPKIDHAIVDPTSYDVWERLIFEMVRHYQSRGSHIRYWEISNEPDIGENGGCPYLFTPESYVRYYNHTAAAILRADPLAKVGGPALANVRSPLFPALLEAAGTGKTPLHFVSWHIYNSDPQAVRKTIDYARDLLAKYPSVHVETFLNEWNMSLRNPDQDPRFQPCYIAETIYQMKEGGLDYSCYYHIRDYQVDTPTFARFMSPEGTAMMTRWWNRTNQFDGLFDYQNYVRPAYFAFKLLSRLTGNRAALESSSASVHGFASRDETLGTDNILLWNFSAQPARVDLSIEGVSAARQAIHRLILDAAAPSSDENVRLHPVARENVSGAMAHTAFELEPYGVTFVWFERR